MEKTSVYFTSDLHLDHYCDSSSELSAFVESFLPKAEVLCVAGDTSDNPKLFVDFYRLVSKRHNQIFLIFGNHDFTVQYHDYFFQNPFIFLNLA